MRLVDCRDPRLIPLKEVLPVKVQFWEELTCPGFDTISGFLQKRNTQNLKSIQNRPSQAFPPVHKFVIQSHPEQQEIQNFPV